MFKKLTEIEVDAMVSQIVEDLRIGDIDNGLYHHTNKLIRATIADKSRNGGFKPICLLKGFDGWVDDVEVKEEANKSYLAHVEEMTKTIEDRAWETYCNRRFDSVDAAG